MEEDDNFDFGLIQKQYDRDFLYWNEIFLYLCIEEHVPQGGDAVIPNSSLTKGQACSHCFYMFWIIINSLILFYHQLLLW